MNEDNDIRVQLARIEGKQDVTNERLDTANKINDERHGAVQAQIVTLNERLQGHGNRIGALETVKHLNEGERRGVALSGRLALILCGAIPVGLIAAALRMLGA